MSAIDDLLRAGERYAEAFAGAAVPAAPRTRVAIVACMDARLDLDRLLGLREGDAHVIRNAGGVVTDEEIRSLVISQRLLGTEEIMLIHHTDCGMLKITDDDFRRTLQRETGMTPEWNAHAFADLDDDLRSAIARIKASPFLPHREHVRGFVYDVETAGLREVT